jgi:threonine dehydrogenase-like Zn-dependent dehydrogenase
LSVARAVWFERPGVASVRVEPLRAPGEGEALVRTICSGPSAGTERRVLLGKVPEAVRAAMSLPSMRGSFAMPISYGYACVGEVLALGPSVSSPAVGARVFALHPHHDRFVARAGDLRELPAHVPASRAVLAANLETAITVVWDASVSLGDRVLVVGLGVVGLLVVHLAARAGASEIVAVDRDEARASLGRALGATRVSTSLDPEIVARADALVEASGSPEPLATLVAHAGPGARVVVASFYGDRDATLPLGGLFHPHRVMLRSSQVSVIPAERRDRWDASRRFALVTELLEDGALDALVAEPVPLSDAPRLYARIAEGARFCPPQLVFDATR